jgi:hypothetical protein
MKTLRHPGVVKVLDTVEVGGVSGTVVVKITALIGRQARQTN